MPSTPIDYAERAHWFHQARFGLFIHSDDMVGRFTCKVVEGAESPRGSWEPGNASESTRWRSVCKSYPQSPAAPPQTRVLPPSPDSISGYFHFHFLDLTPASGSKSIVSFNQSSMLVSGGDIGLNAWVEDDELLFYIGRAGCGDENGSLLKPSRVRLKVTPNPFAGVFGRS